MQVDGATEEITDNAANYAVRLQQVNSNIIPFYLAQYYFAQCDNTQAFAMLNKYTDYASAKPETWQYSFALIMQYYQEDPVYPDGIPALYQKMLDWNAEHIGTLRLSDGTTNWLIQFKFVV